MITAAATAAIRHGDDVLSALKGLVEVADGAHDVLVALYGEGYHGLPVSLVSKESRRKIGRGETNDEAECEPGIGLYDATGHVAAVVALVDHALVALDILAEGVLAAGEEEEHVGGAFCLFLDSRRERARRNDDAESRRRQCRRDGRGGTGARCQAAGLSWSWQWQ